MRPSFLLLLALGVIHCTSVPQKRLYQFSMTLKYEVEKDTLRIFMENPLKCPVRVRASSEQKSIQAFLEKNFTLVMPPESDTTLLHPTDVSNKEAKIRFNTTFGDPEQIVGQGKLVLPFPRGKRYKIIQGYNGDYSHNSPYSRYAIDFGLAIGDTICSAADGFVVGVIEGYKHGGKDRKWRDYANFVTLFHPESNRYTQYVHLEPEGSLVEVGDEVKAGQPIALSGMTGFTNVSHLHFNVLKATAEGVESMEVSFEEGYVGEKLKRGGQVIKPNK